MRLLYQTICIGLVVLHIFIMVCQIHTRLSAHADTWKRIGANDTILKWITEGVPLPFTSEPSTFHLDNYILNSKEVAFIDDEINALLQSGAIRVSDVVPVCVSPLKCVPKRDSFRLIIDLRQVNEHIQSEKFQYECIETVCEYIQAKDKLITLDLKNGFHHVPIVRCDHKYLGFKWRSTYYVWQVLPFGLSCSPYYFCKVLHPIVQFLREQLIRVVLFVDDFLLMVEEVFFTDHRDFVTQTLDELGLMVNLEKSDLKADTSKEYIGYIVTSCGPDEEPWLYIPNVRIRRLKKDMRRCLKQGTIHARMLAKITGQCISMSKAVPPAKLKVRALYQLLSARTSWSDILCIDEDAKLSLQWWLECMDSWNGAPVKVKPVQCQIFTDASDSGWGPVLNGSEASGVWSPELANLSINYRELLAILFALQTFQRQIHGKICADNVRQHYGRYICESPGGPGKLLSKLAEAIWSVSWGSDLQLRASHLAGAL